MKRPRKTGRPTRRANGGRSDGEGSPNAVRQHECGTETLRDGRRIPFYRTYGPNDYICTQYGSDDPTAHGVSLLAKHERRETTTWGQVLAGFSMLEGTDGPSNKLQNVWRRRETRWLYLAASHAKAFPEALRDFRTPESAGSIILAVIENALRTGHASGLELLGKCIAAAHTAAERNTKRQKVADAVCAAARRLGKIPTWIETLQDFSNAGGDADEGNFTRALRDAGFGWLLSGTSRTGCKRA